MKDNVNAVPKKLTSVKQIINRLKENEALTKRDRAKIIGKIQFVAQRNTAVTEALRPAYHCLNSIAEWSTTLPLTSTEIETYKNAFKVIEHPEIKENDIVYKKATKYYNKTDRKKKTHPIG